MEKFELIVDVNTRYIKVIRFIGALGLGFILGTTLSTFKYEGFVDWMNQYLVYYVVLSLQFSGVMKKHSFTIDDTVYICKPYIPLGAKNRNNWKNS